MYKPIDFLGIEVSAITKAEIVDKILEFAFTPLEIPKHKTDRAKSLTGFTGKPKMITYLNAHCANVSFTDFEYRKILKAADLVYAGGQGVVWAARFLGTPLPERVNILDFFDMLVRELRDKKITIYLLGGRTDIVKKTEEVLKKKGLRIIESRDGFFDKTEEQEIVREINTLKPDILMVGMGVSKQERWIQSHLNELNTNLCWAVGGVFNLLAGRLKRAPKWVSDCGLEWFYLGLQDPGRLWKRYLIGNLLFIYRILKWRIKYGQNN